MFRYYKYNVEHHASHFIASLNEWTRAIYIFNSCVYILINMNIYIQDKNLSKNRNGWIMKNHFIYTVWIHIKKTVHFLYINIYTYTACVCVCMCVCVCAWMYSVMCNSLQAHGLQPTKLLCPWNFPGKNTGVGSLFLFQGIFFNPGIQPRSPVSPAGRFFTTEPPGNKSIFRNAINYLETCIIMGAKLCPHQIFGIITIYLRQILW